MSIQKWSDRIWVVRLNNAPVFSEDIDQLADAALSPDPMPHLVLDLSALTKITSSNLSSLLRLRKLLIDRETNLRLTRPNDEIWAVFLTTALDKVFVFSQDTTTALAELQMGA